MATVVLLNPLQSCGHYLGKDERGLPSLELLRQLTNVMEHKVIIVDPYLNKKIKESALGQNPGFRELAIIKEEALINHRIELFTNSPTNFTWLDHSGEDIRADPDKSVVYIDYYRYYEGAMNLNDELIVMSRVEDFKAENRLYLRNIPYDQIPSIFEYKIESTHWFDAHKAPNIKDNIAVYMILLKAARDYVTNEFYLEDIDIEYGSMETSIIKDANTNSYSFVMSQPMLKGFIHHYGLLPDVPFNDRLAYRSTGVTPTVLMTGSNQYRRLITDVLSKFLARVLVRDNIIEVNRPFLSVDTINEAISKLTA